MCLPDSIRSLHHVDSCANRRGPTLSFLPPTAQAFDLGQAINSVGGTDLVEKAKDAVGGSGGVQDLVQQGKDAAQNINAPDLKDAAGKVGEVADKASDKASGLADKIPGVSESNLQNVGEWPWDGIPLQSEGHFRMLHHHGSAHLDGRMSMHDST